jgi:phosphatidylglycerol:prolipoprotein diacylglycerol transferase
MINLNPNPILLKIGPVKIYWYGFLFFLAFWLIFFISLKKRKKVGLSKEDIYNLSFFLLLGSLFGARIYHVLSQIQFYLKNPLEIFFFWQGGLGIYGAAIVDFFLLYIFSKKKKIDFLSLLDFYSPLAILGLSIIRWGNFFNQELYGYPTNSFFKIFIEKENRLAGYENFSFFHPIFLYESFFCLLVFIFLSINEKRKRGKTFFLSVFLYSIFKFLVEFIRIDDQPNIFSLKINQLMSIIFFLISLFFLIKKTNSLSKPQLSF